MTVSSLPSPMMTLSGALFPFTASLNLGMTYSNAASSLNRVWLTSKKLSARPWLWLRLMLHRGMRFWSALQLTSLVPAGRQSE